MTEKWDPQNALEGFKWNFEKDRWVKRIESEEIYLEELGLGNYSWEQRVTEDYHSTESFDQFSTDQMNFLKRKRGYFGKEEFPNTSIKYFGPKFSNTFNVAGANNLWGSQKINEAELDFSTLGVFRVSYNSHGQVKELTGSPRSGGSLQFDFAENNITAISDSSSVSSNLQQVVKNNSRIHYDERLFTISQDEEMTTLTVLRPNNVSDNDLLWTEDAHITVPTRINYSEILPILIDDGKDWLTLHSRVPIQYIPSNDSFPYYWVSQLFDS